MQQMTEESLLYKVASPADFRHFTLEQLQQLTHELRQETINTVAKTGGHLGAGLGVVELSVALHHVFNTPQDKLIWDVGHQSYPHKILTGRRNQMLSLRQGNGLSGFCRREESEYDSFGAGHSSTSISAALGMAVARDLKKEDFNVIAVIGDGAMSAGLAFEALNNAGHLRNRMIVILNDNDMSIAPPVGAMSSYLARLISSRPYHKLRDFGKQMLSRFPEVAKFARRAEHMARDIAVGGTLFDQLGFYYVGPIDGHNLNHLLPVLKNIRDDKESGPVLVHVVTEKGRGFESPEASSEKYHAVSSFDAATHIQKKSAPSAPSYTKVFSESLIREAQKDEKIVAITAAMPSGTGLDAFQKKFPDRCFDVGIAEQHAVTFAAGMAAEGMKPFVAIYSTFLQRAYDQIVHDVSIQNLPVRFAIDRAGLVGADGATHAGAFDIAYLSTLPNMVLMAAADESELVHMVATARAYDSGPIAFRYPRGEGTGASLPLEGAPLAIGKGRIIKEGQDVALLSLGTRLQEALKAAEMLEAEGISVTVADARFAKPLDEELIAALIRSHALVLTLEEGSSGGFGASVLSFAARQGLLQHHAQIIPLTLPDYFIEHHTMQAQYDMAGLNAAQIAQAALARLPAKSKRSSAALHA